MDTPHGIETALAAASAPSPNNGGGGRGDGEGNGSSGGSGEAADGNNSNSNSNSNSIDVTEDAADETSQRAVVENNNSTPAVAKAPKPRFLSAGKNSSSNSNNNSSKKVHRFDRAAERFLEKFNKGGDDAMPEDHYELGHQIEAIEPQLQNMWTKLEQAVDDVDQGQLQYLIDCKKGLEERCESAKRFVADAKIILEFVDHRYQEAKKNNDIQSSIGLQKLKQNAERVTAEGRNIEEREMARRVAAGEDAKLYEDHMMDDKHPSKESTSTKKTRISKKDKGSASRDSKELKTEAQFRKWMNSPYVIDAVSYKSPNSSNQPVKVVNGLAYCICCNMKQVDWKQLRRHFLSQKHKHLKAAYEGNSPTINNVEANAISVGILPTGGGQCVDATAAGAASAPLLLKSAEPMNPVDEVLEKISILRKRELEVRDDDLLPEGTKLKLMEKIKRRKIELCESLEAVQAQDDPAAAVGDPIL